jgi:excisionase family DNA binding protein
MNRQQRDPVQLSTRLSLRPSEAARVLGVSERKFRDLLPQIPHVRDGGTVLIPVSVLARWLEEQAILEQDRIDAVVSEVLAKIASD